MKHGKAAFYCHGNPGKIPGVNRRASCLFLLAALLWLGCSSAFAIRPQPLETRIRGCEQFASGQTSGAGWQAPANAMDLRVFAYKRASGRLKWLNQDPIGERGGLNLHAYVQNNPINRIDPLGLLGLVDNLDDNQGLTPAGVQEVWNALNASAMEIAGHIQPGNSIAGAEMEGAFAGIARDNPKVAQLMKEAEDLFPKKCGKIEDHHIKPKYLGGDPNGPTVPLPAPYHQLITNTFRISVWSAGSR